MSRQLDVNPLANDGTWQTLAHELGHVLGGEHPFGDKGPAYYGKAGGIMDYLCGSAECQNNPYAQDLRLGNEWRFHADNAERVCQTIDWAESTGCPYMERAHADSSTTPYPDDSSTDAHTHDLYHVRSARHRSHSSSLSLAISALFCLGIATAIGSIYLCQN